MRPDVLRGGEAIGVTGVRLLTHGLLYASLAACCVLVLVAVGQPIFTDDLWWHLALGAAYADQGPWLDGDPLLFTAAGAPTPSSWLADLGLFAWLQASGFNGLRLLHVGLVASIGVLVWSSVRRLGGSVRAASLVSTAVLLCSSYRLFQLRPHLLSIVMALLLYRLLLEADRPPRVWQILGASLLLCVWANLHAGFVLGPILIAVSLLSLWLAGPLRLPEARARDRARARGLLAALVLGGAATLLNPTGWEAHLVSLSGAGEMAGQGSVIDEWRATSLLTLPVANLPPSPLVWCLSWFLLLTTVVAVPVAFRRWRTRTGMPSAAEIDPVRLGLALAGVALMLWAVRFLWLSIFPLLLLVVLLRSLPSGDFRGSTRLSVALALLSLLLLPGFLRHGDWPMISNAISGRWQDYAVPYPAAKYHGHAAWLMGDAGLEGNLFARYSDGGFLGYWLAPGIRSITNGSLNATPASFRDFLLLRERRGSEAHPDFLALLDARGVDLFLGSGLPTEGKANRPPAYTTAHLEQAAGWVPIFRNLRSALYLRRNPRNASNLEQISAHYAEVGVPFDPRRGFDPARVIQEAPDWARSKGLIPSDFRALQLRAQSGPRAQRVVALDRLAGLYLLLGLSESARAADTALLEMSPRHLDALRRQVWLGLRAARQRDLRKLPGLAKRLASESRGGVLDQTLTEAAAHLAAGGRFSDPVLPRISAMTRSQGRALMAGVAYPSPRSRRRLESARALPAGP